ncbi:MAG: reactive intermediate/imine deaminase [Lentisphaerae bacterium GWF2_45_14]|nr:MAG: reactive intermediate/imine deaminase [Lentisphaerae bacterium GWF2_45_14]
MNAIKTPHAPAAIGPYSQAVKTKNFVFLSGQLGIDPDSREFAGESTAEQAEQALRNIAEVLKTAGASLGNVVKTTVFLKNIRDFSDFNEVYKNFFSEPFPARSCVQVAALPMDAKVEIEVIAELDK